MTVQSETSKVIYSGNGSTTVFSTVFAFLNNADVKVVLTNTSNIETLLSIGTHYTLTGAGGASGNVTMITAPASGEKLTIYREPPITQGTDYINGDSFDAESHEKALDKLTHIVQSLFEKVSRTVKIPISSTASINIPSATPNSAIGWNGAGTELINLAVVGGALLGNQDIAGWLKATDYLQSREFKILQDGVSDSSFGINYYRAGSTQRDALDEILELSESQVQASNTYTQSGSTTVYAVTFYVLATADLQVKVNGTIVTNYTVQFVGRRNGEMTITFSSAPANGATILIERINLSKYTLRKSMGLFSQHDKNVKLNYIDMTTEFTEFARGIRLPINPNTPVLVNTDIFDCNGVLRHGCHVQGGGNFGGDGQRGVSGITKFGTGAYDLTMTVNAPSYAHPTVTPVTTVADITATAIRQASNVYRIYTKLARTDTFIDCQFYFGLFY